MLKLHTTFAPVLPGRTGLYRLSYSEKAACVLQKSEGITLTYGPERRVLNLPLDFDYLGEGDIVRINEQAGQLRVLYRKESQHNVLFVTEQCNSRCIMCSQPPRDIDDSWLTTEILEAVPLMDRVTPSLGISGGEPTLLFPQLLKILVTLKTHLPDTSIHMLTNGRCFSSLEKSRLLADVAPKDFMVGIPLYADIPSLHNFVVQAQGAFDQTVLGIANLARVGVSIEIRIVIHQATVSRLPMLAKFIARNMPFVKHIALMGMEPIGFGKSNFDSLWIEPWEYRKDLSETVHLLTQQNLSVSVYNIPLCQIEADVKPYARKSISDWKNLYFQTCQSCSAKEACCGFFAWAQPKHFPHLQAMS